MRVMVLPCLSEGEIIVCFDVVFVGPGSAATKLCRIHDELQKLVGAIRAKSSEDQTTASPV